MNTVQLLIRLSLTIFCGYIALDSSIAVVSAIWGFSTGIWFMLFYQKATNLYYHSPIVVPTPLPSSIPTYPTNINTQ
jgi:hypothetical protein